MLLDSQRGCLCHRNTFLDAYEHAPIPLQAEYFAHCIDRYSIAFSPLEIAPEDCLCPILNYTIKSTVLGEIIPGFSFGLEQFMTWKIVLWIVFISCLIILEALHKITF